MRRNIVKQRLQNGETLLGTMIQEISTPAIAQIERSTAVDRIDEILSVPGVDVALIGPEDLSVSLGVPGQTEHPMMVEAIDDVITSALRNGIVPAIAGASVQPLKRWMEKGMRMVLYGSDLSFVMESSAAGLKSLRATG